MPTDDTADLVDRLTFNWDDERSTFTASLLGVARGAAARAIAKVGVSDAEPTAHADALAIEFAEERGAELVGMTRQADGSFTPNPNPEWSITEATRDMLRTVVATAVEEGWSTDKLRQAILDDHAFSSVRAKTIARTEIAFAHEAGNMAGWAASNQVAGTEWLLGSEHEKDDECNDNAEAGVVPLGEDYPSGDAHAPAHPKCVCATVAVLKDDTEKLEKGSDDEPRDDHGRWTSGGGMS